MCAESDSLSDLELRLNDRGQEFSSTKEFLRFLELEQDKALEDRFDEYLELPVEEKGLNTKGIAIGDTRYYLHGIVHGQPIQIAPGSHIRHKAKMKIRSWALNIRAKSNHIEYLCEDGLKSAFELPPFSYEELNDMSFNQTAGSHLFVPLALAMLPAMAVLSSLNWLKTELTSPKNVRQSLDHLCLKSLKDARYQERFMALWGDRELPQPIELETGFLEEMRSPVTRFLSKVFSLNSNLLTCQERSLWTARALLKRAEQRGSEEVHYLCGGAHVSEIEYFLSNPDYSFDHLDAYLQK